MRPHCRVTFYDQAHHLRRTLEVDAALPLAAAEIALRRLIDSHISPENLAPDVTVEVIATREHRISLNAVWLPKAKVA